MDGKLTTPPPENGNEQQLYDDVTGVQEGCKQRLQKSCASTSRELHFEGRVCIFEEKDGERRNRRSGEGVDH